ncbi:hypothetical protein ALC60_06288 [Trachymyrmex zeteki]|uniref:Uncharacterized protein n=1 Tax=Mycetomoellerius zeteki TaxID=64791 RepID=A0A151X3C8_9HYME|nr:hypothetical protein ALC60_06288 [Trachymyrmex zeteki]
MTNNERERKKGAKGENNRKGGSAIALSTREERRIGKKGGGEEKPGTADGEID